MSTDYYLINNLHDKRRGKRGPAKFLKYFIFIACVFPSVVRGTSNKRRYIDVLRRGNSCDFNTKNMTDSPQFTLVEVAKNNGVGDARTWIVIKDVIYDVTDYLSEHPGGGELLEEYAGKDGTPAFDDFGHSTDAKNIMKSYKIGVLVEEDRAANRSKQKNKIKDKDSMGVKSDVKAAKNRRPFLRIVCGGCV